MKKRISVILALVLMLSTIFSVNVFAEVTYDRVEIKSNGQCVDTLDGVQALYKKGTRNTDTGDYCCAAYVTKYYKQLYGLTVSNLNQGRTPQTNKSGYTFSEVNISSAKKGDICYHKNTRGGGHWMIVKSASNNKITVIEQNWKWKSGSKTIAAKNRTFGKNDYSNIKIFRLNTPNTPTPAPSTGSVTWPATKNIKTYVISTGNNTTVYETATSTKKYGTIYASDLITINGYSGSRLKVTYPISKGTKTGFIDISAVTSGKVNVASSKWTATAKMTTYRRSGGGSTLGSISKGDVCYTIAANGNWQQVIYPISGGYKMGWIKK